MYDCLNELYNYTIIFSCNRWIDVIFINFKTEAMGCLLLDIYVESTGLNLSVKRLSQGNAKVWMIISYYRNIVF